MERLMIDVNEIEALLAIECQGAQHRVAVGNDGKLRFFDHDSKEIALLVELHKKAGKKPPHACAKLMYRWQHKPNLLPSPFDDIYRRQDERGNKRRAKAKCRDSLAETAKSRYQRRVREAVEACLEGTDYRVSDYRHDWYVDILDKGAPSTHCESERVWNRGAERSETQSRCYVKVPLRWLPRVYSKGLALVGNMFVLDVLGERADGRLNLLVLKQGRGFKLAPRGAIYDAERGKIEWL
jgi:hypothetical protein